MAFTRRMKNANDSDDEGDEMLLDEKTSRKIIEMGLEQQREVMEEDLAARQRVVDNDDDSGMSSSKKKKSSRLKSNDDSSDDDDSEDDNNNNEEEDEELADQAWCDDCFQHHDCGVRSCSFMRCESCLSRFRVRRRQ